MVPAASGSANGEWLSERRRLDAREELRVAAELVSEFARPISFNVRPLVETRARSWRLEAESLPAFHHFVVSACESAGDPPVRSA
jgi:hypothetical protein